MRNNILYIFLTLSIAFTSCEDVLQVSPRDAVDASQLITNANSAGVAINGMYDQLQDDDIFGLHYMMMPDLLSDNMLHSGTFTSYREMDDNDMLAGNVDVGTTWDEMYEAIYRANLIIDLLPNVDDPALASLKAGYIGEAKFVRAITYFHLVRLFGDLPLITTPTKDLASVDIARSSESDVIAQIISDLTDAVAGLADGGSVTRASKGAANAFLAKVQLWKGDHAAALAAANAVTGYSLESDYASLYATGGGGSEAIFRVEFNTVDANSISFWYWDKPAGRHEFAPTDDLMNAYETGDLRQAASYTTATGGGGTHYVTKYNDFATGTDKPYGIRYADVLLLKAEAAARGGDYATATTAINEVRTRAGLADITLDASNFETAILQERRVELAFEGDRWFDLRRTGKVTDYLTAQGRVADKQLLPIPQSEMDTNPSMTQNTSY